MRSLHFGRVFLMFSASLWMTVACGGSDPATGGSGGNSVGTGGGASSSSSGGAPGSGGTQSTSSGGSGTGTGGANASGGALGSGGTSVGSGGRGTSSGGSSSGGAAATGGRGGSTASGGSSGSGGRTGGSGGSSVGSGGSSGTLPKFSFFVTSVGAMKRLSKSDKGFGGDLRYTETTGLAGADKICTEIAETSMPGAGAKGWRAFLSTTKGGENDGPVNAIDRLGAGPWYDRMGRTVALTKPDLINTRPKGADPAIIDDLPNEDGIPNHLDGAPGCTGNACPDNHDILTGTNTTGKLYNTNWSSTCHDWTSAVGSDGKPRCGHSWPRGVQSWMSILDEAGCAPGINLVEMGPPNPNDPTVGSGGGYGGIYCFANSP